MAHSLSRSTVLAGLIACAIVTLAGPAEAKKQKKAVEQAEDTPAATDGEAPKAAAPAAQQSGDVERPKPILGDDAGEGPKADAEGNVSFAGSRSGKGKITVNAPKKEKAKVYLEGRYFGVAPRTINKIPPGDYIVEIVFPNGKSLSKPVSVAGDEEEVVTVGAADAQPAAQGDKPMSTEKAETRWTIAKTLGIGAAVVVVAGLGLGFWEHSVQNDYNNTVSAGSGSSNSEKAAFQSKLDNLSSKGDHIALGANICYIAGAVALVTAVVIGYPAYKAMHTTNESAKPVSPETPGTNMSFLLAPTPSMKGGTAGLTLTF